MLDSKEQTIGQTVYEKLEDMIKQCIKLGYREIFFDMYPNFECNRGSIWNGERYEDKEYYSYHELFSRNSGIMEFVEWEDIKEEIACNIKRHGDGLACDRSVSGASSDRNVRTNYHYMIMGPMTATEKVQYFVDNAIMPQIESE